MIQTLLTDSNGAVYLNPIKPYVRGTILGPRSSEYPLSTAIPARVGVNPGQSALTFLEAPQDGDVEVSELLGRFTPANDDDVDARLSFKVQDLGWRRQLMNRDILVSHAFGSAQNPFVLKKSLILPSSQMLQFQFFNNSTAGTAGFAYLAKGSKYQSAIQSIREARAWREAKYKPSAYISPYWATTDAPVTVAAGGFLDTTITLTQDLKAVFFYVMATVITTGVAGDTQQKCAYELWDPTTNVPLQNSPVGFGLGTGNANFPYVLPCGLACNPRTQIKIRFYNLITDQPSEIFFTLHGYTCYDGKAPFASYQDQERSVQAGPTRQQFRSSAVPGDQNGDYDVLGWQGK